MKASADDLQELDNATERLKLGAELTQTHVALHAMRSTLETFPYLAGFVAVVAMTITAEWYEPLVRALQEPIENSRPVPPVRVAAKVLIGGQEADGSTTAGALVLFAWLLPTIWLAWFRAARGALRRYRLTWWCYRALKDCANVFDGEPAEYERTLRRLDRSCRAVEGHVLAAHRTRGTIPLKSTRRSPARDHAALVAGALRQSLAKVDESPHTGLKELANLLAVVGERHAKGRLSKLLDPDALADAQPVSRARLRAGGTLRIGLAIASAICMAVLVSRLLPGHGIPDYLHPWVTAGTAILAALPFVGWDRVVQIIESLTGR
ncbi:hypothetical protein [Streptomyces sp. NPDC048172]|uniref:hypothetical protein n=1 Tax=Streptomyces sp. NPDC048172 TaxID=3365505 RepID=UPI003712AAC8